MSKQQTLGGAIVAASLTIATLAYAGHIPESVHLPFPESATEADVREKLQDVGFSDIENMRKQGQVFEADAMFDGRKVSIHLDAESGTITDTALTSIAVGMPENVDVTFPEDASVTDITDKMKELGFANIRNDTLEGEVYEARADFADRPVLLRVDLETGIINDKSRPEFAFGPPDDVNIQFPDSVTEQDIIDELTAIGYSDITDVSGEGQVFDAQATWHGMSYKLNIDAETGIVQSEVN